MPSSSNKQAIPFVFLSMIVIVGTYARIQLIHHEFWLDELATAWVVRDSFADIFERCWITTLSPLYYVLVYASKASFGYSEFSLRLPSVVAGVLLIPCVYILTHRMVGSRRLAIFAAFLASLDQFLLIYSYEVRPYALLQLFSLLQIYIFFRFLLDKPDFSTGILLGIFSGLIVLLHYTVGIIFLFEVFVGTVYFLRGNEFSKSHFISLSISILVLSIMMIPLISQITYLVNNKDLLATWMESRSIESAITIYPHLTRYLLLPSVLAIISEYALTRRKDDRASCIDHSFPLFFLFAWYFIPVLTQLFLAKIHLVSIYHTRYLSWIVPAPIIASAILVTVFRSRWAQLVWILSVVLITQAFGSGILLQVGRDDFPEAVAQAIGMDDTDGWKQAVNTINNSDIETGKVYVVSGLVEVEKVDTDSEPDFLLRGYLLSPVNCLYNLSDYYMERAVPIHSVEDIQDSESNYLIVGDFDAEEVTRHWEAKEMSPGDAWIRLFHVKGKRIQSKKQDATSGAKVSLFTASSEQHSALIKTPR